MDTIAEKPKAEVSVKIDAKAGATGNLLEMAEKASPSGGEFNCLTSITVVPDNWPKALMLGSGRTNGSVLMFQTFTSHDCRRHLDLLINKYTGMYEVVRNDFLAQEVSELEVVVWRDKFQ